MLKNRLGKLKKKRLIKEEEKVDHLDQSPTDHDPVKEIKRLTSPGLGGTIYVIASDDLMSTVDEWSDETLNDILNQIKPQELTSEDSKQFLMKAENQSKINQKQSKQDILQRFKKNCSRFIDKIDEINFCPIRVLSKGWWCSQRPSQWVMRW